VLQRITVLSLVALSLASAACGDDPAVDPGVTRDPRVTPGAFQMRLVLETLDASAPDEVTCAGGNAGECVAEHAGDERIVLEATDGTRYALGPAVLTEDAIATAEAVQDMGSWEVAATLTASGTSAFADITRDAAGERVAVVVEGIIRSTPTVQTEISSGNLLIGGLEDRATAEAVANTVGGTS
jgi:preprotein translocase subunit SecD